ncbi:MAG: hypothetical protein HYZ37_12170 [Candidatus Solibacter usitatus]|nr:hypothetical protein [Candidatus Solibacter usitatus]
MRLLEDRDRLMATRTIEIRRMIAEGQSSIALGKGIDGDAVFVRLEAELDAAEIQENK